jgi:hypothetical protein
MVWLVILALPAAFLALSAFCACVVGARCPASCRPAGILAQADGYAGLPHSQPSR